jgi:hypothetical protein
MLGMSCPEKVSLQEKCIAKWNAYVAAATERGLSIDPQGYLKPPSIGELIAFRSAAVYPVAIGLRGEHLKASRDLSRHLSSHRC